MDEENDVIEEVVENEDVIDKEDDTIERKINRNRDKDKKKKNIMYVVISLLCIILVGLITYIVMDNNNNNENNNILDNNVNDEVVNGNINEEDNANTSNLGYVSCDDNTALLNVRNSTSGNIIDGLSCYKEITIEEELPGTDVCDKWYKISYNKNDSSYTGYACATYIKKLEVEKEVINRVKNLINKANDYYDNSILKAYCGTTTGTKTIDFDDNMTGEYVKSEYGSIEELKNYLYSFLDKSLIKLKLELSDINKPKYNDNYYEIEGSLYCRNYAGKELINYYTNNYEIEVTNVSDNKINVNIAYQYINENSDCKLEKIEDCNNSDFVYEIGKIVIENNIITKLDFHR